MRPNGSESRRPSPATATTGRHENSVLRLRRLGIDTHQEAVVYMRADCAVCRAEGFSAHARVEVRHASETLIATLHTVAGELLGAGEAGLSEWAWRRLGAREGDSIEVAHAPPLTSLRAVRGKVYGHRLAPESLRTVVADVVAGRYSDVELAAFITACASRDLDLEETVALTRSMVEVGERLEWGATPVADKHCVGGLPGNRTTPIVVAIVAALGVWIPKTSSRAITSPAGTADTMEVLAPVDLDLPAMRRVVEREGGCVVWGGAVRLSPADDVLIRIERALDLDAEAQLVASVISKKVAAGASHLVLDLPVGPTAKVRDAIAANALAERLVDVSRAFGLEARAVVSDGTEPVGHGMGPALEARDVLAVVRGEPQAPADLAERAVALAGEILELAGAAPAGHGRALAREALADGRARAKLEAICEAQGGMREPAIAAHTRDIVAATGGRVEAIDNRRIARLAKLAGAPHAQAAGVVLHARTGTRVEPGATTMTVHAESPGELAYAIDFAEGNPDIVRLGALR